MAKNDADAQRYVRAVRNLGKLDPGTYKPGYSEFGAVGDRGYELPPRPDGSRYRPTAASQSLRKPRT